MNKVDGQKTIDFIEGYYHRKLDKNEIMALAEELKDFSFEDFMKNIRFPLLERVQFFTVAQLHKIIEEHKELEEMKKHYNVKNWDDLYDN